MGPFHNHKTQWLSPPPQKLFHLPVLSLLPSVPVLSRPCPTPICSMALLCHLHLLTLRPLLAPYYRCNPLAFVPTPSRLAVKLSNYTTIGMADFRRLRRERGAQLVQVHVAHRHTPESLAMSISPRPPPIPSLWRVRWFRTKQLKVDRAPHWVTRPSAHSSGDR